MSQAMVSRRVLFAAGGSGGHLVPALAVIEALRSESLNIGPAIEIGIAASEKEIDRTILAGRSERVWHLSAVSPSRIWSSPILTVRKGWSSLSAATSVIADFRPSVVVGCGGFASVPIVLAAFRSRIPVVLLEQNLIPGRANTWLSHGAARICVSFDETRRLLPWHSRWRREAIQFTGNPVHSGMQSPSTIPRRSNHLLVLGGSQGARHLNEAVACWITSRPEDLRGWTVTHQTGSADQLAIAARYAGVRDFCQATTQVFIPELLPLYQSATLAIARAGATSLAEMACQGVPAILVPLPSAARNHQLANAQWYVERSAARIVQQAATPDRTAGRLDEIFATAVATASRLGRAIQETAHPEAAKAVARTILSSLK